MNTDSPTAYIMEDPREAMRLEAKVDPKAWVRKYLAHRVPPGAQILSVGCGPGVILREVCATDSSITGTGIDISAERVQEAIRKNPANSRVKLLRGDAHAMQFPSDSFDLVYSRMLFEYLHDKERAAAEMVRVCRPGGSVLIQDLDGQLLWNYPEDPVVQCAVEKVVAGFAGTGVGPFFWRQLFSPAPNGGLLKNVVPSQGYHVIPRA